MNIKKQILRQWTEAERCRFEPVPCLSNLEGEVLAVLLVYWDLVVGVTEVDADCPETVCESLANDAHDVQGVHLERFDAQELV